MTYYYESELYHHGIKGQRWGIRRFQNEDGSLTPAGEKRYGVDSDGKMSESGKKRYDKDVEKDNKPTREKKLAEYYKSKGKKEEDARALAHKRVITERVLIGIGAAALTSAVVYAGVQYGKRWANENKDSIIKAGTEIGRIERFDDSGKLHDEFFGAVGKYDKNYYRYNLGSGLNAGDDGGNRLKIVGNKDVKIAANKKAKEVFVNLLKDEDFSGKAFGLSESDVKKLNKKDIDELYKVFNRDALIGKNNSLDVSQKFYNALRSQGYGAVMDLNDYKFNADHRGLNAKKPLIIFDKMAGLKVEQVSKQTPEQIQNAKQYIDKFDNLDKFMKTASVAAGYGGTAAAVTGMIRYSNSNKAITATNKKKRESVNT